LKRKFDLYLKDIIQAIERVQKYVGEKDIEDFVKEELIVDAVLRNLEIIGEAATQLQSEIKNKYKEVSWKEIQDFRIVIAHHYWKINQQRIWDIIENKLEPLKKQVEDILKNE
tara:strand:- start:299 stop:637 length:339 start_codon:yes stop_codon:yes gene_type:complete